MKSLHWQSSGNGPALVLVHGWAMHSGIWLDFADRLANYCRVICVDLPGHGQSPSLSRFDLDSICAQLARQCPEKSAIWLGWSLGGNVILELARQYPERVDGVVILAGNPCFSAKPDWPGITPKALALFADNLERDFRATILRFLALQTRGVVDAKRLLNTVCAAFERYSSPDIRALHGGLEILKSVDQRCFIAEMQQPGLILLGAQDTLVPAKIAETLPAIAPRWQVQVLAKTGHLPFLTQTETVVQSIKQFLQN